MATAKSNTTWERDHQYVRFNYEVVHEIASWWPRTFYIRPDLCRIHLFGCMRGINDIDILKGLTSPSTYVKWDMWVFLSGTLTSVWITANIMFRKGGMYCTAEHIQILRPVWISQQECIYVRQDMQRFQSWYGLHIPYLRPTWVMLHPKWLRNPLNLRHYR